MWGPNELNVGSIDRIDSTKGYSKDNIQVTLWYVNCMKKQMTDEMTKDLLKMIIDFNK